MADYEIDLGEKELKDLDKLFSKAPYTLEVNNTTPRNIVSVDFERERKRIFAYDKREIRIFYGLMNSLSKNIKEDIIERFGKVDSLCKVVEEITPILQ